MLFMCNVYVVFIIRKLLYWMLYSQLRITYTKLIVFRQTIFIFQNTKICAVIYQRRVYIVIWPEKCQYKNNNDIRVFRAHGAVHLCECQWICNALHACFLHLLAHGEWERVFTHKPCFQAVVWCNSIKSLKSVIYSYVSQLAHPEHEDFQVNLPYRQITGALHWTLHSAHRAVYSSVYTSNASNAAIAVYVSQFTCKTTIFLILLAIWLLMLCVWLSGIRSFPFSFICGCSWREGIRANSSRFRWYALCNGANVNNILAFHAASAVCRFASWL